MLRFIPDDVNLSASTAGVEDAKLLNL